MQNRNLHTENERLKQEVRCLNVKLSDESNNATILAEKLNEMNHAHKILRDENEKLKDEVEKWRKEARYNYALYEENLEPDKF